MQERLPNIVFFDLETRFVSDDFPDKWGTSIFHWNEPTRKVATTSIIRMEYGVACTTDNDGTKLWNDPMELFIFLISAEVDAICTFNGESFDFPVLISSIDPECCDFEK